MTTKPSLRDRFDSYGKGEMTGGEFCVCVMDALPDVDADELRQMLVSATALRRELVMWLRECARGASWGGGEQTPRTLDPKHRPAAEQLARALA